MTNANLLQAMGRIDPRLIADAAPDVPQKKSTARPWIKWASLAACFSLILGVIIVHPTPGRNVPVWENAQYSASDAAKLFSGTYDGVLTNAYTTVAVSDAKYLRIDKMPTEDLLGVYQYSGEKYPLDQTEFEEFIGGILPKMAAAINKDIPEFEIKEHERSNGPELEVYEYIDDYRLAVWQNETIHCFSLYGPYKGEAKMFLDGEQVKIDQRLSDDQIIDSLASIKNKLFDIFGVSFSDTKITRDFDTHSKYGADWIDIYFYNKTSHDPDFGRTFPISDYICISFRNFNIATPSDSILTVADIKYTKLRGDCTDQYSLVTNAKKISLRDAEALLYNGYVFGGHACPLCMAQQDKISFEGYDFVDIEYVYGYDSKTDRPTLAFPFYAFYKKLPESAENGNAVYAKTYVSAIELSGYDEYFQNQTGYHKNASADYADPSADYAEPSADYHDEPSAG